MAVPEHRHGFTVRLQAWWQGQEQEPPADPASLSPSTSFATTLARNASGPPSARRTPPHDDVLLLTNPLADPIWDPVPEEQGQAWPPARVRAAEMIWGRDCLGPGNAEYTVDLAAPFAPSPVTSFLEMHAGLGGGTRALVSTFGVWVTAVERNANLATEGQARSVAADLEKKAQIRSYDPDKIEFKARSFDCILARELFWTIADKEKLFTSVAKLLKDHDGQMVFTDFIKATPRRSIGAGDKWAVLYPGEAHLSTHQEILDLLFRNRLDARADDDISDVFRGFVLQAWQNLAQSLASHGRPSGAVLRHIAREAERWTRFVAALDAGELRVYRFQAAK